LDVIGLEYEAAKTAGVQAAQGDFVIHLDGDCMPQPGWLDAHVAALRSGAPMSAGVTIYEGGYLGRLVTVANAGFLLPYRSRPTRRYLNNNYGVQRSTLAAVPHPTGPVRVTGDIHFRQLAARGITPELVPGAVVHHASLPFVADRLQKGYETY